MSATSSTSRAIARGGERGCASIPDFTARTWLLHCQGPQRIVAHTSVGLGEGTMAGEPTQPQSALGGRAVDDRLDSWKEIAAYLKKEVRTVQRWEKSSGLPVRRLTHGKLGTVFAYKSELDAWWQESQNEVDDGNNSEEELDDSNLAIAELVPTA